MLEVTKETKAAKRRIPPIEANRIFPNRLILKPSRFKAASALLVAHMNRFGQGLSPCQSQIRLPQLTNAHRGRREIPSWSG